MDESQIVTYLRSPKAIRERCGLVFDLIKQGKSKNFSLNESKIEYASKLVLDEIHLNYPDLNVPYHSRWRHFEVGNIDREKQLNEKLSTLGKREVAMAKLELAIVSVLLDAGAGNGWSYKDKFNGSYSRSEGLAVASFDAFLDGQFTNDKSQPLAATALGLSGIDANAINNIFQVTSDNPLLGVDGRAALLKGVGSAISKHPNIFPSGRLGEILNLIEKESKNNIISGEKLLSCVLNTFSSIWPGRVSLANENLGDVWKYPEFSDQDNYLKLVPFHKLSQWLTYSLVEPLEQYGMKVVSLDDLTGLPEYRNGGLFIDSGVLELKDSSLGSKLHAPDSSVVVEWRAATVILLDLVAKQIRSVLKKTPEELALAKILQGGTWTVGRKLAAQKRPQSAPPLNIISDGTVF